MDEDTARFYIAELILAIFYLHERDILYRDLKPENILLNAAGHVKLADFGLSKQNKNNDDAYSTFCGSPAYISPELLYEKGGTKMSDIYGIGTCLHDMLTGEPPYFNEDIPTMYKNIKNGKLSLPEHLHKDTKNFLKVYFYG